MIRDEMKPGDQAFFYHSSCEVPGIVGIMEIATAAYPDPTAFDPADKHFDPASDPDNPRWYLVDVRFGRRLGRTIPLSELEAVPRARRPPARAARQPALRDAGLEGEWEFILSWNSG